MSTATYMVFGDLHGRVLPAFRLACAWARDHATSLAGIFQVGDLGYFPDISRLDKATIRHANDDPLELGVLDIIEPTALADQIFGEATCPPSLWFTAGNHEDFDELERLARMHSQQASFPVDFYQKVMCIQDGAIVRFNDSLKVAAIWGIDGHESTRRRKVPDRAYIREKAINRLLSQPFDILLCHDAPFGAKREGYGSRELEMLIELASPKLVFFGHYKGEGKRSHLSIGGSSIYHLAGLELHEGSGCAESGSVGVIKWTQNQCEFEYVDPRWLASFTRHNWKWR